MEVKIVDQVCTGAYEFADAVHARSHRITNWAYRNAQNLTFGSPM
jgi:hypothetical protein